MGLPATLTLDSPADTLRIRIGTPEDMHDCMRLAMMACEENAIVEPDYGMLAQDMWSALNLHFGIVGLVGCAGKPSEGVALLRVGTLWYSKRPIWEEKSIFVHPDFRAARGGRAKKLAEFSKNVADETGIPLAIGVMSSIRTKGKVAMYSRIFGEPTGAYFLYGVRTGEWAKASP